jgi:hypothetical protein
MLPAHERMLDQVRIHQEKKTPPPGKKAIRQAVEAFALNLKPPPAPSPSDVDAYLKKYGY